MKLVVDASVALKWILGSVQTEPDLAAAATLLKTLGDGVHTALQPIHWQAEIMAVVARMAPLRIDGTLVLLSQTPFIIIDNVTVLRRAATMSASLGHHLFDTLYHALALEADAILITADVAYARKSQHLGHIELLSSLPST